MDNIYFYKIGYSSFEESPYIVLYSDNEYSKEQFRELCADVAANIFKNRRELFKDTYKLFESEEEDDAYDPYCRFEDLYKEVAKCLITNYGFKKLKYSADFVPFGWAKLIPKDDWKEQTEHNEDIMAIRNKI